MTLSANWMLRIASENNFVMNIAVKRHTLCMESGHHRYVFYVLRTGQQEAFLLSLQFYCYTKNLVFIIPWGRHPKQEFQSACTSEKNVITEEINFTAKDCDVMII